ncbi:DUF4817 domain-containing protein [Trichonephila clavipes]|nr:DUF4817 domain-containing protein [Trichonephila clavipes]
MADIHFIYGIADGNVLEARQLYGERYPSRCFPNRKTFEYLHRYLRETGSFVRGMQDTGRTNSARTPELKEHVLREFEEQPETRTRTVSAAANVSHITVWRVSGTEGLRHYHAQWVHALKATDHQPHVDFSRWFLQRLAVKPNFAAHVLFTDKCKFSREGIFNAHNWMYTNPHAIHPLSYQQHFSVNVWAGIIHDHLIGSYLLPRHLDDGTYLVFPQEVLPVQLRSVPANIKALMWFQHDGAPTHYSADVRSALDTAYPGRWIGRGGPVNWPARSPVLSCLDFFLWGHMKSLVYASPVDSNETLVARIAVVAGDIREMAGVFANVRQSLRRRCGACILAGRCSLEQFL